MYNHLLKLKSRIKFEKVGKEDSSERVKVRLKV